MGKTKEDDQQRNWMLYEDEDSIISNLRMVCETLQGADRQICRAALARWKYHAVQSLVEYHQMETRWSIRKTLIETFTLMCSIDQPVISLLFTQGEATPVHYLEQQLGASLVNFLLGKVEAEVESDDALADCFMGLIASYNLQSMQTKENIVLKCLGAANS